MSTLETRRRRAERMMFDTGKALRPTGGYVYDPAANGGTGGDVLATTDLFTSACKIQTTDALGSRGVEVGERTAVEVRPTLHLPGDTDPLNVGDLWEITVAHSLSLAVVGSRYRVVAPVDGTLKTARRYQVERVVS